MRRAALAALTTTTFATGLRAARRLPRPRRALSTRAGAVKPTMGLESFAASADSSWTRCLNADPEASRHAPNKESRQVKSGHYVPVRPSPLPRASLALFSEELAADLGLSEADAPRPSGRLVLILLRASRGRHQQSNGETALVRPRSPAGTRRALRALFQRRRGRPRPGRDLGDALRAVHHGRAARPAPARGTERPRGGVAATPGPGRGYSAVESRRRRGRDVDIPRP